MFPPNASSGSPRVLLRISSPATCQLPSPAAIATSDSLQGTSIYCPPCDFDCKLSEVVRWSGGLVE